MGSLSENVSFGWANGKDVVLQMIIDDGVPSRGHRKNLYGNFKKVGVASGKHKVYNNFSVIDFFGEPKNSELSFDKY